MNDLFGISEDDLRKWLEKYKVPAQGTELAEQRGHEVSSTKDASVKEPENYRPRISASEEINDLLYRISPDCNYNHWFRVAGALKHEGYPYKVFRDWSAQAPDRFDEEVCRKTWDSISEDHATKVSMGTLRWMADQSCSPEPPGQETPEETAEQLIPPEPESAVKTSKTSELASLPEPQSLDEMAEQALDFIGTLFRPGEHFELVLKRGCKDDKCFPLRSRENICCCDPERRSEDLSWLKDRIETLSPGLGKTPPGAWISLNPVCDDEKLAGNAPSDKDVTDFRYALVEADDLNREEQWRKLSGLNLPILRVTWSGGKSLHAIVKVDAGTDLKLYRERIKKLYNYLENNNFHADPANKNPSRLTRIPGFYRDDDKQYLFAGESGPKSWEEFEQSFLSANPVNPESSSGKPDPFLDDLIEKYGPPIYPDTQGRLSVINQNFFAGYTICKCGLVRDHIFWRQYQPDTGLWKKIPDVELLKLISEQLLAYSRQYEVPWLGAKRTNKMCKDIKAFIDAEQAGQSKFVKPCRNVIHARNGMVVIEQDGTVSFKPFSPEYYSTNRTEIDYKPDAKCPMFTGKLLKPCKPDEIECLQYYLGQCLLGRNLSQTFMMLTGTAGAGKSQLLNVIVGLVNKANWTELRLPQMKDRFEMYRLLDKTLATGRDVPSNFLRSKASHNLKSLVGGDPISAEAKGKNECFDYNGELNVVITANSKLTVDIDADNTAWERRMLWIDYNCEPVKK